MLYTTRKHEDKNPALASRKSVETSKSVPLSRQHASLRMSVVIHISLLLGVLQKHPSKPQRATAIRKRTQSSGTDLLNQKAAVYLMRTAPSKTP